MDTSDRIRADEAEPGMRWWFPDGACCSILNARLRDGRVVIRYRHSCSDETHVADLAPDRMICASFDRRTP